MDHLGQAVCPQPRRVDRLKLLPASRAVAPYFETSRVPVIPKQVCGPFCAIEFEPRTPVALNAMTRDHGRQPAIRMPEKDVRNVRTRRSDGLPRDLPVGHNQSFGALNFSHWSENR